MALEVGKYKIMPSVFGQFLVRVFLLQEYKAEGITSIFVNHSSSNKDTNAVLGAPSSQPQQMLITSQRPHISVCR